MSFPTKLAKSNDGEAVRMQPLTNSEENSNSPVLQTLCQNPVADSVAKYLDKESCIALMMTCKYVAESYHPVVKKYIYYEADVGRMTEEEVRAKIHLVNIRVNNLRIYEGCDLDKVRPFFEVMGENMKKLLLTPRNTHLSICNLFPLLRMAPMLENLELHVRGLWGGKWLVGCQLLLPNMEHLHTISLKHVGEKLYKDEWYFDALRSLVDLLLICPNLKQIKLFEYTKDLLLSCSKVLIRYAYLRTGIVIDYENVTIDDSLLYIPVKRDKSFSIQKCGERLYLERFLGRSYKSNENFCDTLEWTKAGVRRPPNYLAALCETDKEKCIASGFQFADVNNPTEIFDVDEETSSSSDEELEEAEEEEEDDLGEGLEDDEGDESDDDRNSFNVDLVGANGGMFRPYYLYVQRMKEEAAKAIEVNASDESISSEDSSINAENDGQESDNKNLGQRMKSNICATQ